MESIGWLFLAGAIYLSIWLMSKMGLFNKYSRLKEMKR